MANDFLNNNKYKREYNFSQIKFGNNKPILEVELNEMQKIQEEARASMVRQMIPSGFLEKIAFDFDGLPIIVNPNNSLNSIAIAPCKAVVFGYEFNIVGKSTVSFLDKEGNSISRKGYEVVNLGTPPNTYDYANPKNNDFVFLEFWFEEVSSQSNIHLMGNINGEYVDSANNIIVDPRVGMETSRRVAIKYRVRVQDNIKHTPLSNVFVDNQIYARGSLNSVPTSTDKKFIFHPVKQTGDSGLFVADKHMNYVETDATTHIDINEKLGVLNGAIYAVPMFIVKRRVKKNTLDSTVDYAIHAPEKGNGTILSYRPDRLYCDEIVMDDVFDIRNIVSFSPLNEGQVFDNGFKKIITGELNTVVASDLKTEIINSSNVDESEKKFNGLDSSYNNRNHNKEIVRVVPVQVNKNNFTLDLSQSNQKYIYDKSNLQLVSFDVSATGAQVTVSFELAKMGAYSGVVLEYSENDANFVVVPSISIGVSDTQKTITGLKKDVKYLFRLKFTYVGMGVVTKTVYSKKLLVVTNDIVPPSQPKATTINATSIDTSSKTVTLNWDASTDNVGVLGYRVFNGETFTNKYPLNDELLTSTTFIHTDITGFVDTGSQEVDTRVNAVAISGNEKYVAIVTNTDPYIAIYAQDDDDDIFDDETFVSIDELPGEGNCLVWQKKSSGADTQYLFVGHKAEPYLTIYKVQNASDVNSVAFTKIDSSQISDLPSSPVIAIDYYGDTTKDYFVIVYDDEPYINFYIRNLTEFNKIDGVEKLNTTPTGVSFSQDGNYVVATTDKPPFIKIYYRNGDNFDSVENSKFKSLISKPNGVSFSQDGNYFAVTYQNEPYISFHKRNGDKFDNLKKPATIPTGEAYGVKWSYGGNYVSVAHKNAPFITLYKRVNDSFVRIATPEMPVSPDFDSAISVDWSKESFGESTYLAVSFDDNPGIIVYKKTLDDSMLNNQKYWVYAYDEAGNVSLPEPFDSSSTIDNTKPTTPTIKTKSIGQFSVLVTIFSSSDTGTGIKWYELDYKELPSGPVNTMIVDPIINAGESEPSAFFDYSLFGLKEFTQYEIKLRAVDYKDNKSTDSSTITVKTLDGTVPILSNKTINVSNEEYVGWNTTDNRAKIKFTLTWTAATDIHSGVKEYILYNVTNAYLPQEIKKFNSTDPLTWTNNDARTLTTYKYMVKVIDNSGNFTTYDTLTMQTGAYINITKLSIVRTNTTPENEKIYARFRLDKGISTTTKVKLSYIDNTNTTKSVISSAISLNGNGIYPSASGSVSYTGTDLVLQKPYKVFVSLINQEGDPIKLVGGTGANKDAILYHDDEPTTLDVHPNTFIAVKTPLSGSTVAYYANMSWVMPKYYMKNLEGATEPTIDSVAQGTSNLPTLIEIWMYSSNNTSDLFTKNPTLLTTIRGQSSTSTYATSALTIGQNYGFELRVKNYKGQNFTTPILRSTPFTV